MGAGHFLLCFSHGCARLPKSKRFADSGPGVVGRSFERISQSGMDPTFQPHQFQAGYEAAVPALLFPFYDDNPRMARVTAVQELLFPSSPRSLSEEIGLNWWAVLKLYEDGWLSFPPEHTAHLDEAQEAELRFIGSLVVAGCDRNMLTALLSRLAKPFAYDLKRVYYDWDARRWRLLPDPRAHPEAAFGEWVEGLVQTGDVASLNGIAELAQDALARVQGGGPQPELCPNKTI
jgi:hypothetical protein